MKAATDSTRTFRGAAYVPSLDRARLSVQIERIRSYMLGVEWRTLREIKAALEVLYASAVFPENSISAQLRNLRKPGFSYRLLRRRRAGVRGPGAGIWEYLLLPPAQNENAAPDAIRVDAGSELSGPRSRGAGAEKTTAEKVALAVALVCTGFFARPQRADPERLSRWKKCLTVLRVL